MDIILSNSSDKPIYEQITSQVKAQILSGTLAAGAKLPSIRALASDLGVSVITTKRAYADLEQLGFICTVQGKGCFVAEGNQELCVKTSSAISKSCLRKRQAKPKPWASRATSCTKCSTW